MDRNGLSDQRANILIVDDRADKLLVFKTVLDDLDQQVVLMRSGESALRWLLENDCAVILLDVNMPGLDGFEACRRLKQMPQMAHLPVIEWDYADGSRSVYQEDCEPLTVENPMERRFTRRHAFDAPGEYQVVVTLRRSDRIVAQASTTIILQGGATTTAGGGTDSASLR